MKIKNLKVRLSALLLAATMAFSLTGCKQAKVKTTFSDLISIEEVKDVTLLDELIEGGNATSVTGEDIISASNRLESYMDIVDLLGAVDFQGVDELRPLNEEEYEGTKNYSLDDVNELITQVNTTETDLLSTENKLIALKKLNFLNTYCKDWIRAYGKSISIQMMMTSVKTSVAEELELSVDDFSEVIIPPNYNSGDGPEDFCIKVGEERYIVPISFDEAWNTIQYIYTLQSVEIDSKLEFETYRKALNYAKVTLIAGSNLKNNKLESQYDYSYIKDHYSAK